MPGLRIGPETSIHRYVFSVVEPSVPVGIVAEKRVEPTSSNRPISAGFWNPSVPKSKTPTDVTSIGLVTEKVQPMVPD